MGFIKKLFDNESTVIGLCDLKKRQYTDCTLYSKNYALNQLFTEPINENILLQKIF